MEIRLYNIIKMNIITYRGSQYNLDILQQESSVSLVRASSLYDKIPPEIWGYNYRKGDVLVVAKIPTENWELILSTEIRPLILHDWNVIHDVYSLAKARLKGLVNIDCKIISDAALQAARVDHSQADSL